MAIRPKPTSKKFRFDVITKNSIKNAAENLVGSKSRQEPKKDIYQGRQNGPDRYQNNV